MSGRKIQRAVRYICGRIGIGKGMGKGRGAGGQVAEWRCASVSCTSFGT